MRPLVGAAAGVAVPAIIYWALNRGDATALRGWAIPTATDIAFAFGILALLGSRVPLGMKLLLSTIAVVDAPIAIVIIAVFHTQDTRQEERRVGYECARSFRAVWAANS